jgi:hypothetical protein
MAKKRDRKGNRPKAKRGATPDGRGLRRHLRLLEKQLAEASRKEGRRVRKLEKAHIRRQRIEAELEQARLAASDKPAAAAPFSGPGKARARSAPAGPSSAKRVAKPATNPAKASTDNDIQSPTEPPA